MTTARIVSALRRQRDRIVADLDRDEARQFDLLLEELSKKGDLELSVLTQKIAAIRPPAKKAPAKKAVPPSEKVNRAVDALRNLRKSVDSWTSPDYDRVRSLVLEACRGFTMADLKMVSQGFLEKANSGAKKDQLIDLLAEPMTKKLRLKFLNVST